MGREKSVAAKFYNTLKKGIIELNYYPGQLLTVQMLSNNYNISRTPVREALVQLRTEGFFEADTGNKFVVSNITWKYINDLYTMRILLESSAIRVSKGNVTKAQIQRLRKHTQKMDEALQSRDYSAMFTADQNFHGEILSLHNNEVMEDFYRRIGDHQQRIRFLTVGIERRLNNSVEEHNQIVDYIEQGNTEEAVNSLRRHLRETLDDMSWLRKVNPMFNNAIK